MRTTLHKSLSKTKINLLVLFTFFCLCTASHAQNIPDVNFAAAIRAECPACITAAPANNLVPAVAAARTVLNVIGGNAGVPIINLTGISGFTSLQEFYCSYNAVTNFSTLSSMNTLRFLGLGNNNLTSLPSLPNGLREFYCDDNRLTSLPTLPLGLTRLDCDDNQLTFLPSLPSTLVTLIAENNRLSNLPLLPNGLKLLSVEGNRFTNLPALPPTLEKLFCGANQLTSLPSLPSTLIVLNCFSNPITSFPAFPSGLQILFAPNNRVTALPPLPASMAFLTIDANLIPCLPNAVAGLQVFNTARNPIVHRVCFGFGCMPAIVASPIIVSSVNQTNCIGETLNLTAVASAIGTTTMTVKWQRKRPTDADFIDVTPTVPYTSGDRISYTPPVVSTADNGTEYRAVFSGTCSSAVAIGTAPAAINTTKGAYIPDIYFQKAIRRDCPTCIDFCNNLTADAARITRLNVNNAASFQPIRDLTGIEGFLNLEVLNIGSNTITKFPRLPSMLRELTINNNNLVSLPELPNSLEMLICRNNNLTALPALPSSLMHLDCSSNKITELPAVMPDGLMALDCSNNELIGLPPSLPVGLKTIYCHKNKIVTLPTLPTALNYFNCGNNMLSDLPPVLPSGLFALICSRNPTLFCLPTLPSSLRELYVSNENVRYLLNVVAGLRVYDPMNEPIYNMPVCNATTCVPFSGAENEESTAALKARVGGTTTSKQVEMLKVFPNPVQKNLQIEFVALSNDPTVIQITDILGRSVSSQKVETTQGLNAATVDMSSLPRGVYLLNVQSGKTQLVRRVMKE
jgi:Leucine-rich repeat (LRR) protein